MTDPQEIRLSVGWYDDYNGEIGDIPVDLYLAGRIKDVDLWDVLEGSDGARYLVQKEWSVKDGAPVAFAATGGQ